MRGGDNYKSSNAHIPPASKGAERHAHASDVQEILPGKAPSGNETTGHRKRRKQKPGPKKQHPRNKANWMPNPHGRYPRSSALKKYIESTKHYYAPSTQAERERKIRYVLTVMESLGAPHCPSKVEEKHIFAFLDWMETRSLTGETKRKLLRFLRDFLAFHDNEVINKLLSRKQIRMPKNIRDQNFRSLPMDIVETIHTATHHIDGWEGSIARFITLAYPYTGLRPSELRTMEFRDIDLPSWTLVVSHPKGEGLYGQHRRVPIAFQVRPAFSKFLTERKEYLKQNGYSENEIPLIPHIGKKGVTVWTHQQFLKIKSGIEQVSGIEFKLKDYRTTFCQYTIDMGADISAVSKIMGHKTTMTTELFYGRIRNDDAITEINRVFMEPGILKVNSRVN